MQRQRPRERDRNRHVSRQGNACRRIAEANSDLAASMCGRPGVSEQCKPVRLERALFNVQWLLLAR